ncbi:MAG TPA: regulatory protein NosR, partial [Rhodospirillales bacterium]|nr:regulatory protein NosR [Rhodospirillales bacterium]
GIDMDGVITGLRLVEHHEPIVLVGIPEKKITDFIDRYAGLDVVALARGQQRPRLDIVSGATVTVMVIDDSVIESALEVAKAYGLGGLEASARKAAPAARKVLVETGEGEIRDWNDLLLEGAVARLKVTVGEVNAAFEALGDPRAAKRKEPGNPDELFIDLYTALVTIPTVGRSLLGDNEYRAVRKWLEEGDQAILLAGRGRYSFKGSGYVRGGIFDRFRLRQGDRTFRFRDRDHRRLGRTLAADGAPRFDEVDVFRIPAGSGFDPAQPWTLELLVQRATGPTSKVFTVFAVTYTPPDRYLRTVAPPAPPATEATAGEEPAGMAAEAKNERPLWQKVWLSRIPEIVILLAALGLLTAIFFFQDWLVRRPKLTEYTRTGFLIFTLFFIGFYANAQLSVVNVNTFFNSLITGFRWEYFLIDPLIFILWGSVAVSLLFWGRGAYCGWLCPFGALQELLNKIAKALKVPQITLPWGLHERLWPIKYIIFLGLFGVSLHSLALSEKLAEVEPFKTSIILKFVRDWPFVLYAVLLLVAGLFVERFYCRYLCPLGAALGIPGRMRMFDWLKRYRECGHPCQRCANECMVQAIHPEGQINPNECLYCLHCQTLYYDDHRCPVMIQKRLRRERRAGRVTGAKGLEAEAAVLGRPSVRRPGAEAVEP